MYLFLAHIASVEKTLKMYCENLNLNIYRNSTDFKVHLHQFCFLVLMVFTCSGQVPARKSDVVDV